MIQKIILLSSSLFISSLAYSQNCKPSLNQLSHKLSKEKVTKLCRRAKILPGCYSNEGSAIQHFDYAESGAKPKKILVMSVVHGDEPESGSVALRWMNRLTEINSRNRWRIIPILNPDGLVLKSRTNANGVDLNRNFPSKDWEKMAHQNWEKRKRKDPRRFPGPRAASEIETRCAMKHIDSFDPDLIISVHTPYGVLDFDGPRVAFPKFKHLPWVKMGTFPGSLGRYMWKDKSVPVLTIELKDSKLLSEIDQLDRLQDISGTIAIRAKKKLQKKSKLN